MNFPFAPLVGRSRLSLKQNLVPRQQAETHNHHNYQNPERHQLTRQRFRLPFIPLDAPLRPDEVIFRLVQHLANLVEVRFRISGIRPRNSLRTSGFKVQIVA
jgi:hypothetical protein